MENQTKYHNSLITNVQFREFAHLSTSTSDKSLTSKLLSKWEKEKKLKKVARGQYQFLETSTVEIKASVLKALIAAFEKNITQVKEK